MGTYVWPFTERGPSDDETPLLINRVRRLFFKAGTFEEVTPRMLEMQRGLRAAFEDRIVEWKRGTSEALEFMRKLTLVPVKEEALAELCSRKLFVDAARRLHQPRSTSWGQMRSREDQKIAMREVIAFRLSQYRKAKSTWTTLSKRTITTMGGSAPIRRRAFGASQGTISSSGALVMAGCHGIPRLIELPEALKRAEEAIAR